MKKKAYIIPEVNVITISTTHMIAYSGGDSSKGDPIVDPNADTSDEPIRSRGFDWGDEADFGY